MSQAESGGLLRRIARHVAREWPATLFVAAVVSLLHGHYGWFDAIDGHALLTLGNMARPARGETASTPTAVVLTIDANAAAGRYLDRSPLERCELLADLKAAYAAIGAFNAARTPVLVIDLDLSPSPWLAQRGPDAERACEEALYALIAQQAGGARPVPTVLMQPIPLGESPSVAQSRWVERMTRAGARFGRATVPVEYGVVTKQYVDAESLTHVAHAALGGAGAAGHGEHRGGPVLRHIDPRKFEAGLVPVAVGANAASTERALAGALATAQRGQGVAAVYFGAGYGEGDTFVTPLGALYGVEIHAAGLLSQIDPLGTEHHFAALLADIVFGFVFGYVIAACWRRYFARRLADDAFSRQRAPFFIALLLVAVAGTALVLVLLSLLLLHRWGIWSSPLPMAVGMLIESFVSGAVQEGTHALQHEKHVGPSERGLRESVQRFFSFQDVRDLRRSGKPGDRSAAALVALRKLAWIGVVGWAFVAAWRGH